MKHFVDNNPREASFHEGDWVMVKIFSYRQSLVTGTTHTKRAKCYYGPFKVIERMGVVSYKLLLLEGSRIHLVFHCSLLKPFLHDATNEP